MKRKSLLCIFPLLLLCILCACGKTSTTEEQEADKIVLTMACYGDGTRAAVVDFNQSQDIYEIEIVDYSNDKSLSQEDARKKLNTELVTGGGTDLIDLWGMEMDAEIYGPKGYLEDLVPWLEADSDLSLESFQQSFMDAYMIDGALYGAVPAFGVMTLLAGESTVQSIESWDFSTLIQLAQEGGSADSLFITSNFRSEFLGNVLTCCGSDYWNIDTLTCNFESNAYLELLTFCGLFSDTSEDSNQGIFSNYVIQTFMEWQYYEAYFGESVEVLGYPSENDEGSCFVNLMEQYGINVYSENKEDAWAFIKYILSADYQISYYVESGYNEFPTNLEALDAMIERSMETLWYEDASTGEQVENTNRGYVDSFAYHAATQAHVNAPLAMINGTTRIYRMDSTVVEIAQEEAEDYFSGQKAAEQVAEITQNRVTTYLEEQQ